MTQQLSKIDLFALDALCALTRAETSAELRMRLADAGLPPLQCESWGTRFDVMAHHVPGADEAALIESYLEPFRCLSELDRLFRAALAPAKPLRPIL